MIGDYFIVMHPGGSNQYTHATIKKTIIDYLDRVNSGMLVVLNHDGFICAHPQGIAQYLIRNFRLECAEASTFEQIKLLAECPSYRFLIYRWTDAVPIVTLSSEEVRSNQDSMQYLSVLRLDTVDPNTNWLCHKTAYTDPAVIQQLIDNCKWTSNPALDSLIKEIELESKVGKLSKNQDTVNELVRLIEDMREPQEKLQKFINDNKEIRI